MHMGAKEQQIYAIDFRLPEGKRVNNLVTTVDTEDTGFPDAKTFIESNIERVEFGSRLSIWVRYSEVPVTLRAKPRPQAKEYQLKFELQGTKFVPEPDTIPLLRMIDPLYARREKAAK